MSFAEVNLRPDLREERETMEETVIVLKHNPNEWPAPENEGSGSAKSQLRFFAVGPSSYQIRCPLCRHTADTETVHMVGALGDAACLLSVLSCCFPVFWLSCVYCTLQGRLRSKRLFCNKCGGYLGFHQRPT